jgi:hypothetical protein
MHPPLMFRNFEWHQKTYHKISWGYPFQFEVVFGIILGPYPTSMIFFMKDKILFKKFVTKKFASEVMLSMTL